MFMPDGADRTCRDGPLGTDSKSEWRSAKAENGCPLIEPFIAFFSESLDIRHPKVHFVPRGFPRTRRNVLPCSVGAAKGGYTFPTLPAEVPIDEKARSVRMWSILDNGHTVD